MVRSTEEILEVPPHASTAVAAGNVGTAGHSTEAVTVGQVITGPIMSVTVMVRLQEEVLLQASIAVQVRVTLNLWGHKVLGVVTSTEEILGVPPHASTAVAAGNVGTAGHSTEAVTVGQVITGPVISVTVMVRLQEEVLLQASIAVQVRVTLNLWGHTVLGVVTSMEEILGVPPHASTAVAAGNVGTAGHSTEAVTVGQVITGPVLSVTAMVRLQVEVLPQASVAVQVRRTLNSWAQMPLGVVRSTEVITGVPHPSVAVAAGNVGTAGHSTEAVTVGQVITGAMMSDAL